MARTKPGEERRKDLLDAAESLVLRESADALTVDDVVAGAGVAKGTFYLHFANKADLMRALRDRYVDRFVASQRAAARDGEGVERVERWIVAGVVEYLDAVELHDVLFHHVSREEHPAVSPAVDELRALLEEIEADVPDAEATAVVLYHAMHGVTDQIVRVPADRERMLAELTRLCRALLTAPGAVGASA